MEQLLYRIWLSRLRLSSAAAEIYRRNFTGAAALYHASEKTIEELFPDKDAARLKKRSLSNAEDIVKKCRKMGVRIMARGDEDYPDCLDNIYDPPEVLYILGELPNVDEELSVAMVGTRKASRYGTECARRIAKELASMGVCIVTGIAEGIDSESAGAALNAGGTAIAVLGTAIDKVYPKWNYRLQEAVARAGAVVSEHPPGAVTEKQDFAARNRIISGLSKGVVIIQAPEKSGSLITAARATEQGRDVFVVPGNIDDAGFSGSNRLIREGAQLITCAADIIEEYMGLYQLKVVKSSGKPRKSHQFTTKKDVDNKIGMEYSDLKPRQTSGVGETEQAILDAVSEGAVYPDMIIERLGGDAPQILGAITMLQMEGYLDELPDGSYRLI